MRSSSAPREKPPRRFWFDPRFGVGIALVVASVAGVVGLVSATDDTERVWAARAALSPGDALDADDLVLRDVRLGATAGRYLSGELADVEGMVVTRTVSSGELVPQAAVGTSDSVRVASVVIESSGRLPQSVGEGSVVDVWSATPTDAGGFGPPAVLVGSATVVRVVEGDGLIVDDTGVGVEVLVPRAKTALVLEGLANGHAMSIVPVSRPISSTVGG